MQQSLKQPDVIDSKAVRGLVEAKAIKGAIILGRPGGWAVVIRYGSVERTIAAQRSRRMRLWRNLNTAASFVRDELGMGRFEVDAVEHDASARGVKRPDQSERLRRQREAAEHDAWFRAQVGEALKKADDSETKWVPNEDVMRRLDERIARLKKSLEASS